MTRSHTPGSVAADCGSRLTRVEERAQFRSCQRYLRMWPHFTLVSVVLLLLMTISSAAGAARGCAPRDVGGSSVVCVCNATYCDTVEPPTLLAKGLYLQYQTSRAGARMQRSSGKFQTHLTRTGLKMTFDSKKRYQRIKGFGGAVTDAAAINILSLSPGAQDNLLKSYFSPEGMEYNLLRVPMASCDFSTHVYTYDDHPGDLALQKFALAKEDTEMKIPIIQRALAMSASRLSLFASPWTSPAWMKTSESAIGNGTLKGQPGGKYYTAWAQYFIRFLDEYARHNVSFWAVTAQNEPTTGFLPKYPFQTLGFSPETQRDFIARDLGPALAASSHPSVAIIILDDSRLLLPHWARVVLSDVRAARYVQGIGVHWYLDSLVPPGPSLSATHHLYPEYFLLGTEACAGFLPFSTAVQPGSWERGEQYSHDILQDLNHYVSGWTDWNLALDSSGGPNWVKNFVDSPVIVLRGSDEFYKQPTFYHLGHFSKFIPEGSQRVGLDVSEETELETVAFIRPEGTAVIIVLNRTSRDLEFVIWDQDLGYINAVAPGNSIQTYLWARA